MAVLTNRMYVPARSAARAQPAVRYAKLNAYQWKAMLFKEPDLPDWDGFDEPVANAGRQGRRRQRSH